jgi:hypothetical protein
METVALLPAGMYDASGLDIMGYPRMAGNELPEWAVMVVNV